MDVTPFETLHLAEFLQERVVLLEAFLGPLEHGHRLLLADLLDQLLEAVLAVLLRHRVLRERDRRGLVGGVELHLARQFYRDFKTVISPKKNSRSSRTTSNRVLAPTERRFLRKNEAH